MIVHVRKTCFLASLWDEKTTNKFPKFVCFFKIETVGFENKYETLSLTANLKLSQAHSTESYIPCTYNSSLIFSKISALHLPERLPCFSEELAELN